MPCAGCARKHQHVLHAARMVRLPPSTTFCCMLDARHTRIVTTLNPQLQATSNCLPLQVQPRQARPLRFHPQHECGYSQVRNSRTCFELWDCYVCMQAVAVIEAARCCSVHRTRGRARLGARTHAHAPPFNLSTPPHSPCLQHCRSASPSSSR